MRSGSGANSPVAETVGNDHGGSVSPKSRHD